MDIKLFLNKFGEDTTTNFDLIQWAKELHFPLRVVMKDEIKNLKRKKLPIYAILNYHLSNQNGIHWVALYKSKDNSYYYDSYGIIPLKEAHDFLGHGIYSTFQIQTMDQQFCGQISIFFLYQLLAFTYSHLFL